MKNIQTKQYLADEKKLNHYFLINKCLYEENSFDVIKNKKVIIKDIIAFSLDIDKSGLINIVCIDDNQRLLFLTKNKKQWDKKIITKIQSFYEVKSMRFYSNLNNENIRSIFLLVNDTRNENAYSIFSYSIKNTNCDITKVIDFHYDNYNPIFKSDIDNSGNLHIIFKTKENDKYKLYYRLYNVKYNKWGLPEKITESTSDLFNTLILCDTTNNINIAWSALLDKSIRIHFIKGKIDLYKKMKWKAFKTLPSNITNLTNPVLIQSGKNIQFGWKQNSCYNFTETNLEKDDWKKVSSIKLDLNSPLIPITIIRNDHKNMSTFKAPYTYLYLSDNNKKILGIDKLEDIQAEINKTFKSTNTNNINHDTQDTSNAKSLKYLNDIGLNIEKSSIVNDICSMVHSTQESDDLNVFIEKLNKLHKEMENVKNKELTLLNSILEIRKSNNKLYKKMEEIINDYHESSLTIKDN
jgi:hypothetical protein